MNTTTIRKILRAEFGDRNYRITSSGEIHVYGEMPNSNSVGWWLFGYIGNRDTEARLSTY